jgi:hypothetical protein
MLIYRISNLVLGMADFVCDSQATIDAAPIEYQPTCTIGGEPEATAILKNNQQAWLTQQAGLFTVNLQTNVEGGVIWTIVNLDTQPQNTDRMYFVLDPTTGEYTEAIGLDAAKTTLSEMLQKYLVYCNMSSYKIETSWT